MSFKQKNRVSVLLEMLSQYLATFINTDIFRTQSNIYDEQKWVTVNPLTVCYFRAKSFIIDVCQDFEYTLRVHFYYLFIYLVNILNLEFQISAKLFFTGIWKRI